MRWKYSALLALMGTSLLACDDGGTQEEPDPTVDMAVDPDAGTVDMAMGGTGGMPDMGEIEVDMAVDMAVVCDENSPNDVDQPPRLNEHSAAYDDAHNVMVIFSGNTGVPMNCEFGFGHTYEDATWIYYDDDNACGHWKKLTEGNPPVRNRHTATFGDGKMWMFGGRFRVGNGGQYTTFNDLWTFDVETMAWTEVVVNGPKPAGRYDTSIVFDSNHNQLLLFAGNTSTSGAFPTLPNDAWKFDIATSTWTEIEQLGREPEPRLWHSALFDAARDTMIVYGGGDETALIDPNAQFFNKVWSFFPDSGRWEVLYDGSRPFPAGRFRAQMVHDLTNDRYLMFGGHDDTAIGNTNELWAFNPEANTFAIENDQGAPDAFNMAIAQTCRPAVDFADVNLNLPERRNSHTMLWSNSNGHAIVFGGKTDCGAVNDVWTFGAEGWVEQVEATEGEVCSRWRPNAANCVNLCN